MRRLVALLIAFLTATGVVLAVPVHAQPLPEPEPVETSTEEVPMGSVEDPAAGAAVQEELTEPVVGVPGDATVLRVSEPDTEEFSLIGVTWAYDPEVRDTVVQVRVRDVDGAWGEWTTVEAETLDQAPNARTGAVQRGGTAPLWTGPSTGVEAELTTRSGAAPTDVRLDLVDPGESDADATAGQVSGATDQANAAVTMPPVVSRAQWGADESLRKWAPQYASTIKAATVHHTADSNNYSADQVPALMRSIYRYHSVSLGWGDIGYNAVVDKFGRIYEGRSGGLASTVMGAHAGGFNTATFGVAMLGNYDAVHPAVVVLDSVAAIVAWKLSLFGVDPRGTTRLTSSGGGTSRYAAGQTVTLPTVFGHRDVGATACPGAAGYSHMDEIRAKVAARVTGQPTATIASRYASDAAARALLGEPRGGEQSADGVTWQVYANGRMYSSPATGVHLVTGDILTRYLAIGGPASAGAPVTDELGTPDGVGRYNHFAKGVSIYWTPVLKAQVVQGSIRKEWERVRWEAGALGYPIGPEVYADGGAWQPFERGRIVYSPATGAHELHGDILTRWTALGGMAAGLYPTTGETSDAGGVFNHFTRGLTIYWTDATKTKVVIGSVRDEWLGYGGGGGVLGPPRGEEVHTAQGATQTFTNGVVVWSQPTGARALYGQVQRRWEEMGGLTSGRLPVTGVRPDGGGLSADFEDGLTIHSAGGAPAKAVWGQVRAEWLRAGGASFLGAPLGEEYYVAGGSSQAFRGGWVTWSPAVGAHEVHGTIGQVFADLGGASAGLFAATPETATPDRVGRYNHFTNGTSIYWSPRTGAAEVHGEVRARWASLGWENGPLGYPTSNEVAVSGGAVRNTFQGGAVYWSPATGAQAVQGDIARVYLAGGAEKSALGLPVSGEYDVPGGRRSDFQHGHVLWTMSTGPVVHLD